MPPGGNRGSIAVVFVACVLVELETSTPPVVAAAALPPDVAAAPSAAEPEADALSVVLSLDMEALDCGDWDSGDKACQLGKPYLSIGYIPLF